MWLPEVVISRQPIGNATFACSSPTCHARPCRVITNPHGHLLLCRLSKRQRQLYDEYMARAETRAVMSGGNFMGVINVLMQLRKVSCQAEVSVAMMQHAVCSLMFESQLASIQSNILVCMKSADDWC